MSVECSSVLGAWEGLQPSPHAPAPRCFSKLLSRGHDEHERSAATLFLDRADVDLLGDGG